MQVYKSLEIWTAQTLCDIGLLLSIVSFLLHVGRPYFERILGRFTLRVAADLWWIAYIILRDGTLFVAMILGFFCLNPDLMADIKVGLPFVPLGTVALTAGLALKVLRNTEDVGRHFWRSTLLVGLGAFLNTLGYVFVMEAPGGEYGASGSAFWQTMKSWRSNANPELSLLMFQAAFGLLLAVAVVVTFGFLRSYRGKDRSEHRRV